MKVELINYTPNPVETMAKAASECYNSTPSKAIVQHCIESGHLSITEFATFHFRISEVSQAFFHQLVRKRIASYAQRSQRYVSEDGFDIVIPESIKNNFEALTYYKRTINEIKNTYNKLVELDIPNEDARFILPNATHTSLHISLNYRSLMDLCNERLCTRAQWEIREVVAEMAKLVSNIDPFLEKYLVPKCVRLGKCPENKRCKDK